MPERTWLYSGSGDLVQAGFSPIITRANRSLRALVPPDGDTILVNWTIIADKRQRKFLELRLDIRPVSVTRRYNPDELDGHEEARMKEILREFKDIEV
jgi:hypothetical protein